MNKDIWFSIAIRADDKTALKMLSVNRKFNECEFFRTVFHTKYPSLYKFKKEDEDWKSFYSEMCFYLTKLKADSLDYSASYLISPKEMYYKFNVREDEDDDNHMSENSIKIRNIISMTDNKGDSRLY